jgi:hypothetical protein
MNEFPQFRKLNNDKSYYCIKSNNLFTEIQLIGQKAFRITIQAEQYPEKLKIRDMLNCETPYLRINQLEFEKVANRVE